MAEIIRFGELIKTIRKKCDETLIDMQERTGFSQSFISYIERGRKVPTAKFLDAVIKVYKPDKTLEDVLNKSFMLEQNNVIINLKDRTIEDKYLIGKFVLVFDKLSDEQKKQIMKILE